MVNIVLVKYLIEMEGGVLMENKVQIQDLAL
jgi:hypothetical protein